MGIVLASSMNREFVILVGNDTCLNLQMGNEGG
jgi:hypothetical protein